MRRLLYAALLVLPLAGCAAVTTDLTAASARAHKAVDTKVLAADDPLPVCLDYLLADIGSLSGVLGRPAGLVDKAVELYILDAKYQNRAELDIKCGPVAIRILRNIGKKVAPFSGALPGF